MKAEYDALQGYVVAAVKAALPGYTVNPDQPQRKVGSGYATTVFMGAELANQNSVFDTATFSWEVTAVHSSPETGTIDEKVAQVGSDLRYALLAQNSPADTGYLPMVTEHARDPQMEAELEGEFVTRTRFTVMTDVRRQPA